MGLGLGRGNLNVRSIKRLLSGLVLPAAAIALAGCAVGPDFLRPAAPETQTYTAEPLPPETTSADIAGGAPQKFVAGADIPGQWWTLFHSESLNKLVEQSLKGNPDLEAAQASLRQAKENYYASEGALFPAVDAGAGVTRQKFSLASSGVSGGASSIFTLYNASVSVSYLLDIWGGTRREIEAAEAGADYAQFQLEASYLSLTSNVVTGAIQDASLRAQIAATNDIIKAQSQELGVLQQQFNLGAVSLADVFSQQAALAQTKASLPMLQRELAAEDNHLSILLGRLPSEKAAGEFDLASLTLPQDLPISLPSKLVEQRPDIRASEALLHQASAEVGVATAALLPQVPLSASYGGQALKASDLFSTSAVTWSLGASILQTIFHGGALWHQRGAAEAALDKAKAQYRSTVLAAFEDVANSLRALQADADALNADLEAERAAAGRLRLTHEQFQAGAVGYLSVLDAERTYQQARITLVQAQAARYADTAALFHALGGGWWNQPAPTGETKS